MPQVIELREAAPDEETMKARSETMTAGYSEMMERPEIKLMVSMIKPTEPPEILQTLLQSFYGAGFQNGGLTAMNEVKGALVKSALGAILGGDAQEDGEPERPAGPLQ
jgi:hypothetical protein